MSPVPDAALECATGSTVEVDARIKAAPATAPLASTALRARAPAALTTVAPADGVLAIPTRDIKADWKRWSWAERITAITIIATVTIAHGLTLVGRLAGDAESCAFCGKPADEAKHLIAGARAMICDECVATSIAVLAEQNAEWRAGARCALDERHDA